VTGRRQKPPELLADHRASRAQNRALTAVEMGVEPADLAMPAGLEAEAQAVWVRSVPLIARHTLATDIFAARRWIHWVNEWFVTTAEIAERGTTHEGSRGPTLHPRVRYLKICEAEVQHGESILGLNPLARMRLGISLAKTETALARLKEPRTKPTRLRPE
jgi:P27 family predicted phage terminase small subunit